MKKLLLSIGLLGLSACSLSPPREVATTAYDFGPVQAFQHTGASPRLTSGIVVDGVTAPAWMDNSGMYYRLAYQNAASPQRYAESRWVMSPAALLAAHLKSRVAQVSEGTVVHTTDSARDAYNLPDRARRVRSDFRATGSKSRCHCPAGDAARRRRLAERARLCHRATRIDARCRRRGASVDPSLRRAHPAHHRLGRERPVGCATRTGGISEGDPREDAVGRSAR